MNTLKHFFRDFGLVLLVVVLCSGTIAQLFSNGFFEVHDNTQVVRVFEMAKSLSSGMLPVRWVEGLGYGYGYPIFNFYGPLAYYVGGFHMIVGLDSLTATRLMFVYGTILASISMFFLSRKYFGALGGVASAVIYSYFPYHAVNIYVRGAVGEFYAYAFLPFVFLGLLSLIDVKKERKIADYFGYGKNIGLTAIAVSLVALSHNLSMLMIGILTVPFLICAHIISLNKRFLYGSVFISFFLGIGLASFYIIPAIFEMNYTNVTSQIGGGADFRDHFVCIGQYWNSAWGFGGSVPGCVDGFSFKLGKPNIILFLISILLVLFAVVKKKFEYREKIVVLSIVLFVFSTFMTLPISQVLWNVPYFEYIQYPWRFVNFMALFIAFVSGYTIWYIRKQYGLRVGGLAAFIVVATVIANSIQLFSPQLRNNFESEYYQNKEYVTFTVSKISDEYLPKNFSKPKELSQLPYSKVELKETTGNVGLIASSPRYLKASYETLADGALHVNIAYFPAWKAYVDGVSVPITQVNAGMDIKAPSGRHVLEMKFEQTGIEKMGNFITIVAFSTVIIGIMLERVFRKKRKNL